MKIAGGDSHIEGAFNRWNAATPWEKIDQYKNPDAIRPVVDLILLLQALKAGGLDFDYELALYPGYDRAKVEASLGHADLSAETIWDREIAEHGDKVQKTDPVIRTGEFEKGLYVLSTNEAALEKGLKALHAEGRFEKAYKESGFLSAATANWIRLK